LARDCLIVFAIGIVYKILFIMIFLGRTANASRNLPAEKDEVDSEQQPPPSDVETVPV
jgi:hypothetical protein